MREQYEPIHLINGFITMDEFAEFRTYPQERR
jgi:hypothetical protein